MNNKTKFKKLKIVGLTAFLVGGITFGGVEYYKYKTDISLTDKQMEDYIRVADEILENLNKTIDSKDTDSETKFEARQARKQVMQERADMQKRLAKMQKRQDKTINFYDAEKVR